MGGWACLEELLLVGVGDGEGGVWGVRDGDCVGMGGEGDGEWLRNGVYD